MSDEREEIERLKSVNQVYVQTTKDLMVEIERLSKINDRLSTSLVNREAVIGELKEKMSIAERSLLELKEKLSKNLFSHEKTCEISGGINER